MIEECVRDCFDDSPFFIVWEIIQEFIEKEDDPENWYQISQNITLEVSKDNPLKDFELDEQWFWYNILSRQRSYKNKYRIINKNIDIMIFKLIY